MTSKQTQWEVWEGYASWHQKRAGNYLGAAVTTGFDSQESAEAFATKLRARGVRAIVLSKPEGAIQMTSKQTLDTLCALAMLTRARQHVADTCKRTESINPFSEWMFEGDPPNARACAILWASKLNMIRDPAVAGACALHFCEQPWGSRMFFQWR